MIDIWNEGLIHWGKLYKDHGFSNFADSSKGKPSSTSDGSDFDNDSSTPDLEDAGSSQNSPSVPLSESPEAARSAASSHLGNPVAPVGEEEEEGGVTAHVGNLSLNAQAG